MLGEQPFTHFHNAVHSLLLWSYVTLKSVDRDGSTSVQASQTCFTWFCQINTTEFLDRIVPNSRSKPNSCLSTTNASKSTARTWPTSTFILLYLWQFNILPSAVRTPADYCFQKWHTALLTSVYEHPESINAVHSCPSTCTFMKGSFLVFSRSGRRLLLMPPPLWHFPGTAMLYVQGHCIWSNVSHDEPCAYNYPASLGDSVSSPLPCGWDHHTCSNL